MCVRRQRCVPHGQGCWFARGINEHNLSLYCALCRGMQLSGRLRPWPRASTSLRSHWLGPQWRVSSANHSVNASQIGRTKSQDRREIWRGRRERLQHREIRFITSPHAKCSNSSSWLLRRMLMNPLKQTAGLIKRQQNFRPRRRDLKTWDSVTLQHDNMGR